MNKLALAYVIALVVPSTALAQEALPAPDTFPAEDTAKDTVEDTAEYSAKDTVETGSGWDAGTKGLSFGVPSGGGGTFGMAYFLDPSAALRFDVGFSLSSTDNGVERSTVWGFSADVNYRMYKLLAHKVYMFVQAGGFLGVAANEADFGQRLSIAGTGGVGVEYMFTPVWTISGTTGGSLVISNEFKNYNLSTGTSSLFVNWYW